MPVETPVTRCGNCGASLPRGGDANELPCPRCQQLTYRAPAATAALRVTASADDGPSLHEQLLRGPLAQPEGRGTRYDVPAMTSRDPVSPTRGVWPSGATASSTFGGLWSPSSMLGPPRVYPRCGDIGGAWAPRAHTSPVEWVEVEYALDVPVSAVRVYETNRAGSTFAVVDLTHGERILYAARPTSESGARVLEVAVEPPRPVRRLRVYLVNPGWAELDTVGLLAVNPLPEALRARPHPPPRPPGLWLVGLSVLVALALGLAWEYRDHHWRSPPPRPALAVPGATFRYTRTAPSALEARDVTWASGVGDYSSQYGRTLNAASDIVGAPDVYPRHGDIDGAWASRATDGGAEWIEVRFPRPVRASAIVWAETFNPGAVARVEDVSAPGAHAVLWEGSVGAAPQEALLAELTLAAPRELSAVRIVLDTRRVVGWNEIDAVGLVPAP